MEPQASNQAHLSYLPALIDSDKDELLKGDLFLSFWHPVSSASHHPNLRGVSLTSAISAAQPPRELAVLSMLVGEIPQQKNPRETAELPPPMRPHIGSIGDRMGPRRQQVLKPELSGGLRGKPRLSRAQVLADDWLSQQSSSESLGVSEAVCSLPSLHPALATPGGLPSQRQVHRSAPDQVDHVSDPGARRRAWGSLTPRPGCARVAPRFALPPSNSERPCPDLLPGNGGPASPQSQRDVSSSGF
uniref:Uncharacterized protein n=1 Tax=Rangifer tarandus platyrhynchus TaxID=3082113 RepID=A0ACB0EVS4_RANTA|nr:unnamed protein product [Rangifer tarandus platyrhynchus]